MRQARGADDEFKLDMQSHWLVCKACGFDGRYTRTQEHDCETGYDAAEQRAVIWERGLRCE